MTVHRFHPDPARGENVRAVVYDDCPRCDQLVADPTGLDPVNLWTLWRKMERADHPVTAGQPPVTNSANEAFMILHMRRFALLFEALTGTVPSSSLLQSIGTTWTYDDETEREETTT